MTGIIQLCSPWPAPNSHKQKEELSDKHFPAESKLSRIGFHGETVIFMLLFPFFTLFLLFWHCSPADLDELVIHSLQYRPVLHSRSVLQRFLSHLLLPLQPVLDHADAAAGPRLLPAVRHHTCHCAPAQVHAAAFFRREVERLICAAGFFGVFLALITGGFECILISGSAFIFRYFYRACQNSLVPSPVQVGRRLDKSPAEAGRSPKSPLLSLTKPSPKVCNKKDSKTAARSAPQKDCNKFSDSEKGPGSLGPTKIDSLLNTKDPPQVSGQPQLPPSNLPECFGETLETSDLSVSGCITSTPLLAPMDSIQLKMPPDGDLQCVKYTRISECEAGVRPAQRTEPLAEQLQLHTNL